MVAIVVALGLAPPTVTLRRVYPRHPKVFDTHVWAAPACRWEHGATRLARVQLREACQAGRTFARWRTDPAQRFAQHSYPMRAVWISRHRVVLTMRDLGLLVLDHRSKVISPSTLHWRKSFDWRVGFVFRGAHRFEAHSPYVDTVPWTSTRWVTYQRGRRRT